MITRRWCSTSAHTSYRCIDGTTKTDECYTLTLPASSYVLSYVIRASIQCSNTPPFQDTKATQRIIGNGSLIFPPMISAKTYPVAVYFSPRLHIQRIPPVGGTGVICATRTAYSVYPPMSLVASVAIGAFRYPVLVSISCFVKYSQCCLVWPFFALYYLCFPLSFLF
jgi:hypothetical protein